MEVLTPSSVDELSAALRDTTGVVAVCGRATKAGWGGDGVDADVVIDTSALNHVVEHAHGDLVVTVQAGVRLDDLQQQVGLHRQWLALDPPESGGSIGGTLATAVSGPRRLRFGTPRDLLLGVTVVLADGTVARSGGKVVKNVAGYDLGKLFTGSYGTLGVIAQATLRLHPVFVARRVVSVTTDSPWSLVREVLRSPATPTAVEWYDDQLHVVIESSEAAVDAQAQAVAALVGGAVGDSLPDDFGGRPWHDGDTGLKVTFRLSALNDVIRLMRSTGVGSKLRAHAGSGVLWAGGRIEADVFEPLRSEVAGYGGAVTVVAAPRAVKDAVDLWGPVGGLDVMRRIKEQFDPGRRMNPGRFVGGI